MSTEDLWKVVGRARFDLAFGGKLKQDFAGTVHEAGYELSSTELSDANVAVDRLLVAPVRRAFEGRQSAVEIGLTPLQVHLADRGPQCQRAGPFASGQAGDGSPGSFERVVRQQR